MSCATPAFWRAFASLGLLDASQQLRRSGSERASEPDQRVGPDMRLAILDSIDLGLVYSGLLAHLAL